MLHPDELGKQSPFMFGPAYSREDELVGIKQSDKNGAWRTRTDKLGVGPVVAVEVETGRIARAILTLRKRIQAELPGRDEFVVEYVFHLQKHLRGIGYVEFRIEIENDKSINRPFTDVGAINPSIGIAAAGSMLIVFIAANKRS